MRSLDILAFDYTNLSFTGIVIFFTAFLIGIKFPDWDFKLKLRHRNILTHSPMILLFFTWMYMRNPGTEFRYFIMGFSLAIGIHLIFDIFPKGWGGGALLQMPFIKYRFKKNVSILLFILFILVSLGVGIRSTQNIEELIFISLYGIGTIVINRVKEEKVMRPMCVFLMVMLLISSIKYNEVAETVLLVYTNVQKTLINLL